MPPSPQEARSEAIELQPQASSSPSQMHEDGRLSSNEDVQQGHDLPPIDGGRDAWLVLAGCALLQVPVWGFSLAFGVFQEYYATHPDILKGGAEGNIAIIGTTSTGILYLSSPLTFTLLTRYPHLRTYCGPLGLFLSLTGFLLSSFSTTLWQLIATQGVLCAIGNGLLFSPSTLYLDEWFVRRKGLAYGVMWSAKSAAGVGLPFAVGSCLERFGVGVTLRGWTVLMFLITAPLLKLIKSRTPLPQNTRPRKLDLSFLRMPNFWMLQLGNIIQSFGYFLPSTYLSSYSTSTLGVSSTTGTLMISLFNATSVVGGIILGMLTDHFAVADVILLSSIGSTLAVFLLWGLSTARVGVTLVTIFSITYGFFAGGFSSTWSGVLTEMKRASPSLETGLVFGLLAGGRGIGNVISGPLSTVLIEGGKRAVDAHGGGVDRGGWGYDTKYGPLIIFTGVTALLGGWGWMWRELRSMCA
ncbi:hypothetical protein FQN54_004363 [Arachnomyces sp. PD_36]|nr:hypothetical protein FQN54_004363 [Arachnomyces sp. PD_36]